eukprot:8101960-Ditylum_brightwellii.AAC.1
MKGARSDVPVIPSTTDGVGCVCVEQGKSWGPGLVEGAVDLDKEDNEQMNWDCLVHLPSDASQCQLSSDKFH